MRSVNAAVWSRERIIAYKKYLEGNTQVTFRGKKRDGTPYRKALPVETLIKRTPSVIYSTKGGKLFARVNDAKREILSGKALVSMVHRAYENKALGVGKAPSIYQWLKTKYAGFGYSAVATALKSNEKYQKYEARHLQKKESRTVIISRAPGAEIDCDLMFFSRKYFNPAQNDNMQGLVVVVDRFSGMIAVRPISFGEKNKSAEVVARKVEEMLRSSSFPKVRGRTIFTDNGSEMQSGFSNRMRQLGYTHVIVSRAAGAPSPHAENAVRRVRALVNQKLSAMAAPKKNTQSWWPLARALVRSYNETPMTDSRAPHTPNQLAKFTGRRRSAVVAGMTKAGATRLSRNATRKGQSGEVVPRNQPILTVGSRVRAAIEHLKKTGANKRPYPKQRWSSKVYVVARIHKRKLGLARYSLKGIPSQRFERADLQLIGKAASRSAQSADKEERNVRDDATEDAVARQGSRRLARH